LGFFLNKTKNEKGEEIMMKYRKIRRNIKAISPVISVLLMIAIAVVASLVTYAWVMGYMNFTTDKVGKSIQIQSMTATGDIYLQNIGTSPIDLSKAAVYVNGILQSGAGTTTTPLAKGETFRFDVGALSDGNIVKVVSTDGTFSQVTFHASS
jgi:flagellin-like protein